MRAIVIAAVLFCAGLIGLGVFLSTRESGSLPRILPQNVQYTNRIADGGWVKGNKDNPTVTVLEYADFQCPGCAAMAPIIDQAFPRVSAYTKFTYANYPLPKHNKARLAALAAESAGMQGKYWEMHDILFSTQTSWENQALTQFKDTVISYAQSFNINMDQFRNDLSDSLTNGPIDKDITAGNKVPVQGTPTLIINGTALTKLPQTADELVSLIEAARQS